MKLIIIPGSNDPVIENEGTVFIGKGRDLRKERTVCVTDIANLLQLEDIILIRYFINDKMLLENVIPKSEEERPFIIITVTFPGPSELNYINIHDQLMTINFFKKLFSEGLFFLRNICFAF